MKRLSFMGKALFLAAIVCAAIILWDFVQTGTLPDPVAAAREVGSSVDQHVHAWFEGLR
jgi:hypothetical protein